MPSSAHSCFSELKDRIEKNLVESIDAHEFLPTDKLHEIFTHDAVKNAVEKLGYSVGDRVNLAEDIYDKGRRTFAMLIYDNQQDLIVNFRHHEALDHRLPLSEDEAMKITERRIARQTVRRTQYMFCPYTFPENMRDHDREIGQKIILPFIGADEIGAGTFGVVQRMTISPSHHNFYQGKQKAVYVARKRLVGSGNTQMQERERTFLRILARLEHPNIVPLWGSYTHRNEKYLLFPCFDMNLGSLLETETRHKDFQWDFTFYSALTGLASALSHTHHSEFDPDKHRIDFKSIGYHHDLRPANILVSADSFILADFGMGRLKQAGDPSHTQFKSIGGDYVAPENTDRNENALFANRATDVWAFGCLIVEVVTYMLAGVDGVVEFRTKRLSEARVSRWKDTRFYQPISGNIKQEVIDWVETLKSRSLHPDVAPLLLDLALEIFQHNPRDRPDMDTIYRCLEELSMRKHFQAVECKFREVIGAVEEESMPLVECHLQNLRYAQKHFKAWGNALSLSKKTISSFAEDQSKSSVATLKELLQELREEPEKRDSGDGFTLPSSDRLIIKFSDDLLKKLPNSILQSVENELKRTVSGSTLVQQIQYSHHIADGYPSTSSQVNTLKHEFEEEARKFTERLDKSVLSDILEVKSIDDLYSITDKIQEEQHKRDGLRNLPRIRKYLERLKGYSDIIDDIIEGNHDVLALLWGPIGFLLQSAKQLNEAYDLLLGTVAEIGGVLPDFQDSSISNQSIEAKRILVLFFKDLLQFYDLALNFFCRPNWVHVFDQLWPTQHAYYSQIAGHIGRLRQLTSTEIRIEYIQQEEDFQKSALNNFKMQTKETLGQDFYRIMTSFSPHKYGTILYHLSGLRCKGTETWLMKDNTYKQWVDRSQEGIRILWLRGIPGAGKTVLSSAILNRLKLLQRTKTACAFLTYKETKTTALSTLQSLIFQLAERDEDLMTITCNWAVEDLSSDINSARNLLSTLVRCAGLVYFVIDGVDEIGEGERDRLVTELIKLVEECGTLRIILSTRPEADLELRLSDKSVFIEVHEHNKESIDGYISGRIESFFSTQDVFPDARAEILTRLAPLADRARGMFLYARIIMDMIDTINDLSQLKKELEVLPKDLDAAYHRIIERLGNHTAAEMTERARRLLGWVACSTTPITVEEAGQALLVMSDKRDQVFSMVSKPNVVKILGPIVEVVDNYIVFVHFTAKEYISSPHLGKRVIDTTEATLDLAMQCIHYLCQRHHDPDLLPNEHLEKFITGQYTFHAFATRMWFELVCQYLELIRAEPSVKLVESIQMLWELRKTKCLHDTTKGESEVEDGDESDGNAIFKTLKGKQPFLYQMLCQVSQFRKWSFLFTGKAIQGSHKNKRDPFSMSDMSQRIRQILNEYLCASPTYQPMTGRPRCHDSCTNILQYYGSRPFKCRFMGCVYWQHGFRERAPRDRHELCHDKPLKCHVTGCEYELVGFLSQKMRENHLRKAHQGSRVQLSFDAGNMAHDQVNAILRDLIRENQVEAVRKILSTSSGALNSTETQHQLRLLGASGTSSDMLILLEQPTEQRVLNMISMQWVCCIEESIKGRNESTLEYFLSRIPSFLSEKVPGSADLNGYDEDHDYNSRAMIISKLLLSGWTKGMGIWLKWMRGGEYLFPEDRKKLTLARRLFADKRIILAASKSGRDEQLIYLWRESGVASLLGKAWANQTLRNVAETTSSITLARYLLDQGADVNDRRGNRYKTALHLATMESTAKRAEMIRFLLQNGADPEADQLEAMPRKFSKPRPRPRKIIREEAGAQTIDQWLGKKWDDLIEETKTARNNRETGNNKLR